MNRASAARLTLPRLATSRNPSTCTSWIPLALPLRDSSMATAGSTNSIYTTPGGEGERGQQGRMGWDRARKALGGFAEQDSCGGDGHRPNGGHRDHEGP